MPDHSVLAARLREIEEEGNWRARLAQALGEPYTPLGRLDLGPFITRVPGRSN